MATNAEQKGAKMQHLKGTTRHRQNLKRCRDFMRRNGVRGKDIFRYEWRNWKRIAQVTRRQAWRGRQWKAKAIMRTVYREGTIQDDNWSYLASRLTPVRPVAAADATPIEGLHNEWVAATLQPNTTYSVKSQAERQTLEGLSGLYVKTTTFQVISVVAARG